MSTLALVGLLVVLLVALGIVKVLRRGRGRDSGRTGSDPSEPPRTVADLVKRREEARRAGLDADVDADTGPIPPVPSRPRPSPRASGVPVDAAGSPVDADAGAEPGTEPLTAPEVSADEPEPVVAGAPGSIEDADDADDGADDADGVDDADETAVPEDRDEPGDAAPPPNRPGSDADTGPASAPWSRGFVGGRQITPPTPSPRTPSARDTPSPRRSAPGESGPRTSGPGEPPSRDAVTPAPAGVVAEHGAAAGTGEADVSARPSAPPRQESRSPVDPDLVKRVTAVPAEGGIRTSGPDTEREYRQARDRMSGTTGVRSVPEQASRSPETEAPPAPASGSRDRSDDGPAGPGVAGAVVGGAALVGGAAAVHADGADGSGASSGSDVGSAEFGEQLDGSAEMAGGEDAAEPEDTAEVGDAAEPEDVPAVAPGPLRVVGSGVPSPFPRAAAAVAKEPPGVTEEPPGVTGEPPADEPSPRPTPRVMRSAAPEPGPEDADPDGATAAAIPEDDPDTDGTTDPDAGPPPRAAVEPRNAAPPAADPEIPALPATGPETPPPVAGARPAEPEPVVAFSGVTPARREPVPGSPAQDVEVRVADRGAGPLPRVAVSMRDGSGAPVGSATTDDDGAARLRAPGAGHYVLVTAADGFQTAVTSCAVADQPVRVGVTLARSAGVHGVVRSAAGEPRPGVRVAVEQDGEVLADADTGADGGFRFAGLPAGYYRLLTDGAADAVHLPAEADVEHDLRVDATAGAPETRNRA